MKIVRHGKKKIAYCYFSCGFKLDTAIWGDQSEMFKARLESIFPYRHVKYSKQPNICASTTYVVIFEYKIDCVLIVYQGFRYRVSSTIT